MRSGWNGGGVDAGWRYAEVRVTEVIFESVATLVNIYSLAL